MSNITQSIKENITITRYAEMIGLHPILRNSHSDSWYLQEHDSCIINLDTDDKQRFIWNSRQLYGSVIDFCMAFRAISQEEAIQELREILGQHTASAWVTIRANEQERAQTLKPAQMPFVLPAPSQNGQRRLFAYLIKTRGLDAALVTQMVHEKSLYQDERGNAVFVGKDYNGEAKYAFYRSTLTDTDKVYRGEVGGSVKDVNFSMNLVGQVPRSLFLCEAAIDAVSVASMLEYYGKNSAKYAFLSLGGTADRSIVYHLPHQPQLQVIYLCQDNDEAGNVSRQKIREKLQELGFQGKVIDKPPVHKDFNEDLRVIRNISLTNENKKEVAQTATYQHIQE